jgi:hypothetical protein
MIRIIQGHNKRLPTKTLELDSSSGLSVALGGMTVGGSGQQITWGPARPGQVAAQSRIQTASQNREISLTVRANGVDGPARIAQLQRDLAQFGLLAKMAEEGQHGGPVYLAYRVNDGLESVPEPVIGQWSTYTRILDIATETWPDNLLSPGSRKMAWDMQVKLTVAPYSEGDEQAAGVATGAVRVDPQWGVVVCEGVTGYNKFSNSSFSNSTYSTGWSSSGTGVFFAKETREGLARAHGVSVLLGAHAGSDCRFYQSVATSTERWIVSFYAKRLDGQPVTSADCEAYVNGSTRTSYYIDNKDGWYRVFGAGNGSASANENGVEIKAGHSLVIDQLQLEEYSGSQLDIDISMPRPYFFGHMAGSSFSGSEPNSSTDTVDGKIDYSLGNEISGFYTIAGWFTPTGIVVAGTEQHALWEFREGSGVYTSVAVERNGSGAIRLELTKDGTTANSSNLGTVQHTPIHVAVVQDGTNCTLYVNGASSTSIADSEIRTTGGTLTLGYGQEVATDRSHWAIDGFRVFPVALTAAQIDQLYDNELGAKTNGDIIGLPTYAWTYDGAGSVENDDDSANDDYNHMLIGGVGGDQPAEVEFHITNPTGYSGQAYWIGRKEESYYRGAFKPNGYFYRAGTTTTDGGRIFEFGSDTDMLAGRVSVVAIIAITTGITTSRNLEVWAMNSPYTNWPLNDDLRTMSYAHRWGVKGVDLDSAEIEHVAHIGDVSVNYAPGLDTTEAVTIQIESATTMPSQWAIEKTFFVPYPNIWINQQKLSSDTVLPTHEVNVVRGTKAWARRTTGEHVFETQTQGDGVDVIPDHYNHIYFLIYDQGKQTAQSPAATIHDETDNFTVDVYVTPRYSLPGGPLA